MKTPTTTKIVAGLLALSMLAAACGGSDSAENPSAESTAEQEVNPADQELIDAIAASMDTEAEFPESVDLRCMAGAIVTGLGGAEELEAKFGVTPASIDDGQDINDVQLPKDEARRLSDSMIGCGLMQALSTELAGDGITEDDAQCLAEKFDRDIFRDVMATEFMNETDAAEVEAEASDALFASMFQVFADCELDPEELG